VAEREGFEPSVEVSPHTRLAGEHLQPTRSSLRIFRLEFLAEGVGFEPTNLSVCGFQDRRLKPLGHPSNLVFITLFFHLCQPNHEMANKNQVFRGRIYYRSQREHWQLERLLLKPIIPSKLNEDHRQDSAPSVRRLGMAVVRRVGPWLQE
jgi:hypothetical protein